MTDEEIHDEFMYHYQLEAMKKEQLRQRVIQFMQTEEYKNFAWRSQTTRPNLDDDDWEEAYDAYRAFKDEFRERFKDWMTRQDEEAAKKRKTYAFTFTTNLSKEQIEADMMDACYRLYKQTTIPVRQGEAYLEYTEAGRPHIHGWYETEDGGRIFSKQFKRVWPTWGETRGQTKFAGGYHEEMKTNRYKGYAAGEDRVIIIKKIGEPLVYNAPPQSNPNS